MHFITSRMNSFDIELISDFELADPKEVRDS